MADGQASLEWVIYRTMSIGTESPLAKVRRARLGDAKAMAETYVAAWRDCYPDLISASYLVGMSAEKEAVSLRRRLATATRTGAMLVAETADGQIIGLAECGQARQPIDAHNGELFILYVHPDAAGKGVGRDLFHAATSQLIQRGINSMLVWVLAANPARWFYQAMGGRPVGHREIPFAGQTLPAVAYGWHDLGNGFTRL